MDAVDLYNKFEDFRNKEDDVRVRLLRSYQQRIIYTKTRINGYITFEEIDLMYNLPSNVTKVLNQFVTFGILKPEENGRFSFIPVKRTDDILDDKDENILRHNKSFIDDEKEDDDGQKDIYKDI